MVGPLRIYIAKDADRSKQDLDTWSPEHSDESFGRIYAGSKNFTVSLAIIHKNR
jgi:hypothetical protein